MKKVFIPLILFLFPLLADAAHASDDFSTSATPAQMLFSFETLTLDEFNNETMGLLGGQLLFEVEQLPWLSVGAAAYGTMTGERGGFITLGFASDAAFDISESLTGHAGIFVGAGGGHGGYQLQGGGLMLREHLGLVYESGVGDVGLGVSHVNFPNGHVKSGQGYMSYAYNFYTLVASSWWPLVEENSIENFRNLSAHEFGMVYRKYDVHSGVSNAAGGAQYASLGLVGVEWAHQVNNFSFVNIEAEGAMQGHSNGYMQILLGAGLFYDINESLQTSVSISAGVAGGGAVDTGGGLLADVGLSLKAKVFEDLSLEVELGQVRAPQASFAANSLTLKFKQEYATPVVLADEAVDMESLTGFSAKHVRVRVLQQTYFELPNALASWRTHHANRDVNLLGFQNDYFLDENFFLTGQGIAAYEGQAGGYMIGLLGAGLVLPLYNGFSLEAEGLIGAAGGGGLAVGGGLVWQSNAGVSYHWGKSKSVLMQVGRIEAPKGDFAANVLSLSMGFEFSLFTQ